MKITVVLIFSVFFVGAKADSESCDQDEAVLTCRCDSDEDIDIYYVTTDTIASLNVFSCASANLTIFLGPRIESTTMSIKVENITDVLLFCPSLQSVNLSSDEFLKIGYLAEFKSECTLKLFASFDHFQIENTVIGTFDQSFYPSSVVKFILKNVTISDLRNLEFPFMLHGSELRIIDSFIKVTANISLFFQTFENVTIANTTFEFSHGGNIVISGTQIHIINNTFLNASVDVTGKHSIRLIDTSADGRASAIRLRVTEPYNLDPIVSHGNRLPYRIIYIYPERHIIKIIYAKVLRVIVNSIKRMFTIITTEIDCRYFIHQGFILCIIIIACAIGTRI